MAPPENQPPASDDAAAPAAAPAKDLNGINLPAVIGLVDAVRGEPAKGQTVWKASSTWRGGTEVGVAVRGHRYTLDEPPTLGGGNRGPNMVEEIALAAGSCLTIGYVLGATSRGLPVSSLGVDVQGDLNLGKFLGVSAEKTAGFHQVSAAVRLDTGRGQADEQAVRELHEHVVRTSPLGSILTRPVDVSVELAGREAEPAPGADDLVTNGVPLDAVSGLVAAVTEHPEKRDTQWRTETRWAGAGLECHNGVRDHRRVLDEPPTLAGGDRGVNPVEAVVGAFGACLVVGVALQSAVRGIRLRGLRVDTEGDLDLQPFLGLAEGNAGFSRVRARVHVDAPEATDEQLRELLDYVVETSPVGSILREPLPLSVELAA